MDSSLLQEAWERGYEDGAAAQARVYRARLTRLVIAVVLLGTLALGVLGVRRASATVCQPKIFSSCGTALYGGCCSTMQHCVSQHCLWCSLLGSVCDTRADCCDPYAVCASDHLCRKLSVSGCSQAGQSCNTVADCCAYNNLACVSGTCRKIVF